MTRYTGEQGIHRQENGQRVLPGQPSGIAMATTEDVGRLAEVGDLHQHQGIHERGLCVR